MWFLFTIISSGSHNGWAKFSTFSQCENDVNKSGSNNFGFAKFLMLVEIALYSIAIGVGIWTVKKVHTDNEVVLDPFEAAETT